MKDIKDTRHKTRQDRAQDKARQDKARQDKARYKQDTNKIRQN